MSCQTGVKAAVIERGDGLVKAGLAGEATPKAVFKTSGCVSNVDDMVKDCKRALCQELKVNPAEYPLLITVPPLTTEDCKHQMAQKLFDILQVPAVQFSNQSVLAAFAAGKKTAFVVDCGPEVTWFVAMDDGYSVQEATLKLDVGGVAVMETGGNTDALFNPSVVGCSDPGVHQQVFNSISKCEADLQAKLWKNIVLAGGATLNPEIKERLQKELKLLAAAGTEIDILVPPTAAYSIWIGGSILATIEPFQTMWITREEYKEQGAAAVQKKNLDTYRP